MNKKLLISVLLCFFVFYLGILAEEKPPIIEHVFWEEELFFNETYLDTPEPREYESEPLISFYVPPSPKSEVIFFDFGCQSSIWWYEGHTPRLYQSNLPFEIFSEVIPDDIIVYNWCGMEAVTHEILPMNGRPNKTTYKLVMRRDDFLISSWPLWRIKYVSTGENVPIEIANNVLNDLIDNGFNVEMSVFGKTEGVEEYVLVSAWIHVTRATK